VKANVVVIGGGPAGVAAVLTYRLLNEAAKIVLIRKDEKQLIPCGIPYIFRKINIKNNLMNDEVLKRNNIELIVDKAIKVDRFNRKVILERNGELTYEYLILATGSKPMNLGVKGEDLKGIFYVKESYERLIELKETLENASTVTIVGGSLAGVEFANELANAGYKVLLIETLPCILKLNFDVKFASKIEDYLKDEGVNVLTNTSIAEFRGNRKLREIVLTSGKILETDVCLITTGMVPNTSLAKNAGLEVTDYGIKVDPFMLTSDPRIYAIGDCAEKRDFITGKPARYMLASIAAMEARVAAVNIAKGNVLKIEGIVPKYVSKVGDIVFGAAGLTENQAKENNVNYKAYTVTVKDKYPQALPGVEDLTIKLIFSRKKRLIIGGQVLGYSEYVGSLVNTIGALIENYVTADDIVLSQQAAHPLVSPSPIANPLAKISLNMLK